MRKTLFTFIAITSGSAVFAQVPSVSEKGKADMLSAYVEFAQGQEPAYSQGHVVTPEGA